MATYTYSNGNYTSTTNIVNGVSYTQNVTMLGGTGNGCGDNTCPQGYSLYFPCLKTITRGQDVCFEFYAVDNTTQDVIDFRDIDALTISLSGRYNCPLGDYSYPDDISSLQSYSYKTVVDENFNERNIFELRAVSVDEDLEIIETENISGLVGRFYENKKTTLVAGDTKDSIFVGWIDIDSDFDTECDDQYLSTENSLTLTMNRDWNVAAVYRDRKTFKFVNVTQTVANFDCYYDGTTKSISERNEFLEGYYVIVKAVPTVGNVFDKWIKPSSYSKSPEILREICFDSGSDIKLGIETTDSYGKDALSINYSGEDIETMIKKYWNGDFSKNEFDIVVPTENVLNEEMEYFPDVDVETLFSDDITILSYDNISCCYIGKNCYIKMGDDDNDGSISISNPGMTNKTIIEIYCNNFKKDIECSLTVKLDDDDEITQELPKEELYTKLYFEFDNVDFKKISIGTVGEISLKDYKPGCCLIDRIVISDENVIDKGKGQLCIPGSVTSTFHVGQITATGAIMVNGSTYGLPCTQIGSVSSIPTITTI